MKTSAPLETKVAASSGAALLVTTLFAVLHWLDPHLGQPPAYVLGLLVTVVTLAAGWLAPHTSRTPQPAPPEPPLALTAGQVTAIRRLIAEAGPGGGVWTAGSGTGGGGPMTPNPRPPAAGTEAAPEGT